MHQIDERVPVAEIDALSRIYGRVLRSYFDGAQSKILLARRGS
jgi:hypothetical protein